MRLHDRLTAAELEAFQEDPKIGLLATIDPGGAPRVTLISTLGAESSSQLCWGQFCQGQSKQNIEREPRAGFLVMTPDRRLWRGRARFSHSTTEGPAYEAFNRMPMFRYNAYMGIHRVFFMDLVGCSDGTSIAMPPLLAGYGLAALACISHHVTCCGARYRRPSGPAPTRRTTSTLSSSSDHWASVSRTSRRRGGEKCRLGRPLGLLGRRGAEPALKPWAWRLLNRPDTLKFVAHIDDQGWPTLSPAVSVLAADRRRLVLADAGSDGALADIPAGAEVALFALNLQLESVLLRGTFSGLRGALGRGLATLDIDWVYNSMPPTPGQIFPMPPLDRVTDFTLG